MKYAILTLIALVALSLTILAQRPRMDGPPEWAKIVDVNKNGRIDREEFREAAETFFQQADANKNGVLERVELPGRPGGKPGRVEMDRVPPFLFLETADGDLNREAFLEKANAKFVSIDSSGDGAIDWEEIKAVRPNRMGRPDAPDAPDRPDRPLGPERRDKPNRGMAEFVGAEMRFGDKLVKGAPFSADTIREESKRLFDGSLVKSQTTGQIFRDGEGRVRREMPFETIAGFPVLGREDQPLKLVHIVDHVAGKTYSLNTTNKTYFNVPFRQPNPLEPKNDPLEAKNESLGTKTIEGVAAEGTRTTIEIPAGRIGNEKPILVVTEKWYSPHLQLVVMSKHTDPFIGEVTFRMVNIKLAEPASELFKIPGDFKESAPRPLDEKRPMMNDRRPGPGDRRPPLRPRN